MLSACLLFGTLSAPPARAFEPILMFLFGMAREVMYDAFLNSQKAPQPNSEPLPAVYPGTMVEPRKLRELIDESFYYLSERRREALFQAFNDELIKPKNATVRASMIQYFAEHAYAVRNVMDRLSKLTEPEMRALSEHFAAEARSLPVEDREKLRTVLEEGLLPVPPDLNRMLVVGSNLRKDHPLMAHRIRESVRWYGQLNLINAAEDEFLGKVHAKRIVAPSQLSVALAGVCAALAELKGQPVPAIAAHGVVDDTARKMAESLAGGETRAVFLGNMAQHHPTYSQIHALAQEVARLAGASFGVLGEAANSVGAVAVGAIPLSGPLGQPAIKGLNARQMLAQPLKAYLMLAVEAELDTHDPVSALSSINGADFVVVMSPYKGKSLDYADVLLPIAPWTETSGTFINTEGRVQSFGAVVKPLGETRPAWKVLRVLGNLLGLAGFDHNDSKEVLLEAVGETPTGSIQAFLSNEISGLSVQPAQPVDGLERVADVPIYQTDAVVRRSPGLQMTLDAALPVARMHSRLIAQLGLEENGRVSLRQTAGALTLKVQRDDLLPVNCVRVPCGHPLTASLGPMFGPITAERV